MLIAERLKSRMDACGFSQAALARKVGVSQQSIGRLVSGEAMGSRYLHKIAAVLATTPAYLTGETDDPTSELPDDLMTHEERELVDEVRRLTSKDRAAVRQLIRSLAGHGPDPKPAAPPLLETPTLHTPQRRYAAGG